MIDDSVTSSATRPSEHGTNTRWPNQAGPPKAPAQTDRLAICTPRPPIWPALSRYATPSFPIATTAPIDETNVAPTDPRSASLASSDLQLEGVKNDPTCRSGESSITELL